MKIDETNPPQILICDSHTRQSRRAGFPIAPGTGGFGMFDGNMLGGIRTGSLSSFRLEQNLDG
ncbi:MAG: hypothetical protein ACREQR_04505 [Candidatus Binataceae bacterium]